ncbi:unnamed protein product [Allacma fusca]|uniref:Endothelin-converting enzyme 1 n=1 Tax=Allacma fusca TaxID=39272 RepID=A0A8J2PAU6_9HEXA|nr:unnamed protein product [Allacma fusca]
MLTRVVVCIITAVILIAAVVLLILDWHYLEYALWHHEHEGTNDEDPCNNFYNYACADWTKQNRLPLGEEVKWSVFTKREKEIQDTILEIMSSPIKTNDTQPLKLAKRFFLDCNNTDEMSARGMAPLVTVLEQLGGWTFFSPQGTGNNLSLTESILRLKGMAGWDKKIGFYKDRGLFYVKVNPKPEGEAILTIYPPSIVMEHIYLKPFSVDDPYVNYRSYIHAVISEIYRNESDTNSSSEDEEFELYDQVDRMVRFEARLANAVRQENFETSHTLTFSIKDFQLYVDNGSVALRRQHRTIDWVQVFKNISPKLRITANHKILVIFPVYFQELGNVLGKTNLKLATIKNFLIWTVVSNVISETTDVMRDIQARFDQNPLIPRELYCSSLVDNDSQGHFFSWIFAVGNEFVQRFLSSADINLVGNLIDTIRESFITIIGELPWLDTFTKTNLEAHLKSTKIEIGYPPWIKNLTMLELFYKGIELREGYHFENYLAFMNFQAETIGLEDSSSIYLQTPMLSVSPRYTASAKTLSIPGGVFGSPYFYPSENLSAENFGAMGTIIGHEMSHAIYSYLKVFAKPEDAPKFPLWSNDSENAAEEKFSCLKTQYRKLAKTINVTLTGSTLQEDVADNVGFAVTYSAFERWEKEQAVGIGSIMISAQKFFLAFAKIWCANYGEHISTWHAPHSRTRIRVTAMVSNSPGFSEVWNCSKTTSANGQCRVFN